MTPSIEEALRSGAVPAREATSEADAYLRALLDYSGGFYGAAVKHGMRAGQAADAVQHIERAARNLHRLASTAEAERDRLRAEQSAIAKALAWSAPYQASLATRAEALLSRTENAEARALAAEAKCDAAFAFITKLVHMQSGQGWTRAVVRGAAANFLGAQGVSIAPGVDTTPEMIARALTQEQSNVGE